jgi:predicted RNA-binding protein with PUA-like domain
MPDINYWLVKSEPDTFSWDDLNRLPKKTTHWDGVRNFRAKNNLRSMKKGDRVFFYHSGEKEIVGVCEVVREGYPDTTPISTPIRRRTIPRGSWSTFGQSSRSRIR